MAIDWSEESILTFVEVAKRMPRRRRGRPVNVATIHRWAKNGVRGVRLESLRLGGGLVTSVEALQRFAESLTAGDGQRVVRTSAQRERAADRAEAELEAAGV